MTYDEDPDYRQLRLEFLTYIRQFHERHDYTTEWRMICGEAGIELYTSGSNYHATFQNQSIISVDPSVHRNRQDYTGLHELCHHFFETADEGFRALLEEKYLPEVARQLEEDLCREGAGILLAPDHVLALSLREHGYYPEAIFALTTRMGSIAACMIRFVFSNDVNAWGLVMRRDGVVEFSCTNTRYKIWKDHTIENSHVIHQAWHGSVETRAAIPYHGRSRKVKLPMRAGNDGRRVVALFSRKFPVFADESQPPLFT